MSSSTKCTRFKFKEIAMTLGSVAARAPFTRRVIPSGDSGASRDQSALQARLALPIRVSRGDSGAALTFPQSVVPRSRDRCELTSAARADMDGKRRQDRDPPDGARRACSAARCAHGLASGAPASPTPPSPGADSTSARRLVVPESRFQAFVCPVRRPAAAGRRRGRHAYARCASHVRPSAPTRPSLGRPSRGGERSTSAERRRGGDSGAHKSPARPEAPWVSNHMSSALVRSGASGSARLGRWDHYPAVGRGCAGSRSLEGRLTCQSSAVSGRSCSRSRRR
jgi:hypothetical protein